MKMRNVRVNYSIENVKETVDLLSQNSDIYYTIWTEQIKIKHALNNKFKKKKNLGYKYSASKARVRAFPFKNHILENIYSTPHFQDLISVIPPPPGVFFKLQVPPSPT